MRTGQPGAFGVGLIADWKASIIREADDGTAGMYALRGSQADHAAWAL
jgi:hypothetical protein